MEYVFGTHSVTDEELLKTKGDHHTNLSNSCEVVREYPDCVITDSFRVLRRMKSSEDAEGNCYDWYIIDRHNRIIDRTKPIKENLDVLMASMLEE